MVCHEHTSSRLALIPLGRELTSEFSGGPLTLWSAIFVESGHLIVVAQSLSFGVIQDVIPGLRSVVEGEESPALTRPVKVQRVNNSQQLIKLSLRLNFKFVSTFIYMWCYHVI